MRLRGNINTAEKDNPNRVEDDATSRAFSLPAPNPRLNNVTEAQYDASLKTQHNFNTFDPPITATDGANISKTEAALRYVASYPDLIQAAKAAGVTSNKLDVVAFAVNHYADYGRAEGRSVTFNSAAYAKANPDLAQNGVNNSEADALHYIQYGSAEHRNLA